MQKMSLNCTKFDKFLLRKIMKFVTTGCRILKLKCTEFDLGWGSASDRTGGASSAPLGPTFKGRVRERRGKGEGNE